jgi:hypothetical protein
MEELFGSVDTCACAHCRSVYSPAAYLTDLLQWLKNKDNDGDDNTALVLESLLERRPDLEHILLNCQNANTPLPYIDLVNEVLEYAIGKNINGDAATTQKVEAYKERNTTWSAEALRLQAEHQLDVVYEQFVTLPHPTDYKPTASYSAFNLWQSQFHLYLERLGIDAYELVQEWGQYDSYTDRIIAETAAYFRMPTHEVMDIVSNHYNYGSHAAASSNVEQFLKQHAITYAELVELLQLKTATWPETLTIETVSDNGDNDNIDGAGSRAGDDCSLSNKQIVGLTDQAYSSLWKFLRLWKYTRWTLSELNKAILHPNVGGGVLVVNTLEHLVKLHQLQQQTRLGVEQLLTLFGDMDTSTWTDAANKEQVGLYQQVYLAEQLDENLRTAFDPSNITVDLSALTSEQTNYIATALGISVSMLETILYLPIQNQLTQFHNPSAAMWLDMVKDAAPLTGLSQLYAYSLLAKTFDIDLNTLQKLAYTRYDGTNVFINVATFQQFIEELQQLKTTRLSTAALLYIIKHQQADEFLDTDTIAAWDEELSEQLDEAYLTLFENTDVDAVLLRNLLIRTGKFDEVEPIGNVAAVDAFLEELLTGVSNPDFPAIATQVDDYLGYLSQTERDAIVTAIQNADPVNKDFPVVPLIKQALHTYLNREVVYNFISDKFNLDTALLDWFMQHNAYESDGLLANRFVPVYGQSDPDNTVTQQHAASQSGSTGPSLPGGGTTAQSGAGGSTGANTTIAAYHYIQKFALWVAAMKLTVEELDALEAHANLLNPPLLIPSALPLSIGGTWTIEQWLNTQRMLALSRYSKVDLDVFLDLLSKLKTVNDNNGTTANFTAFFTAMKKEFSWDFALLEELTDHFNWEVVDFLNPAHYETMMQWMAWVQRSNEQFAVVKGWPVIFDVSTADYLANQKNIAAQVKQSLQSRVSPEQWQKDHGQVQDEIRLQKRDALVAHARNFAPDGTPALLSVTELYKYYLIDPAMSACQYTSRIKQAISSVQLFVQRCLMGLEDVNINQAEPSWKQWKWMQNYRVWEANRKVFLYPENWVEPALRDNKTELFKEFEDKLLQAEVTNENVERSLQEYLVKLHHISNLEMKSICQGANNNIIYVLARTKENPADYYYRKLDKKAGAWTGWEKIEGGIKGEHPVLQFYNNRLHVFWLEILEKPQELVAQHPDSPTSNYEKKQKMDPTLTTTETANRQQVPHKYKEIKLAWMVLYNDGWSSQTLSKDTLVHPWPRPEYSLHLRPRPKGNDQVNSNDLWLDIYVSTSMEFNHRKYYNQFTNEYEKLTTEAYNENARPWHSASFVFDGFVRTIKVKPITGTYWYVGWEQVSLDTSQEPSLTVLLRDEGPVWVTGVTAYIYTPSDPDLGIKGGHNSDSLTDQIIANASTYQGYVSTNYVNYHLADKGENGRAVLNKLIADTKHTNAPTIEVVGVMEKTNEEVKCIVKINGTTQWISREELNNYIQTGNKSTSAIRPTRLITVPPISYKLVLAEDPNEILFIDNSNSHEYIYHSFGETGRKIKKMSVVEERAALLKIPNMHYHYNHLVPNIEGEPIANTLGFDNAIGLVQNDPDNTDWKVTIPMDASLSTADQYGDIVYQDHFRAFYIERDSYLGNDGNTSLLIYRDVTAHGLYHPYSRRYLQQVGSAGMTGLYDREIQLLPNNTNLSNLYDRGLYTAGEDILGRNLSGLEQTSFDYKNGYAIYNWEIFFHIPLMIATELSKNQRFEEAMQWFHFIFNPMGVPYNNIDASSANVSKYWITKPFFEQTQEGYEDNLIQNLLGGQLSQETINAINVWKNNPFQPHVIARMRPIAYQKAVVMKYVDNLVAWGDQLFRRETLESINQAALRYIMAAEILGDDPNTLASREVVDQDYATIKDSLDGFSNSDVVVQLENAVAVFNDIALGDTEFYGSPLPPLPQMHKYFCIPKNEKLAGYWDLVGDRLFKIRNCMNIDGVVRQLPLFAPPIDPALLVNAVANGINLSSVLDDLSLPKLHYKYRALGRLAIQFCGEVKSLGQSLLSALQSKDAEGMALLQSSNAIRLLDATVSLKELQIQEAEESIKSLELSRAAAEFRKEFYEGRKFMIEQEKIAESKNIESVFLDRTAIPIEGIAQGLSIIPRIDVEASALPGITTTIISGLALSTAMQIVSGIIFRTSNIVSKEASMAATQGSYQRRQEEWDFQAELAQKDIEQIDQQIATAKIRVDIANKDLENHRLQIENAASEREYMQSKYTNQQLYSWMVGQISGIYFQAYQLAYDMAKKAEKSMRYELALPTELPSMIGFGYWDSLKKGLLAGDKLMLAINQMEATYIERNSRELELTKHISLHQLAPEKLIDLRTKGNCQLDIPQWWFDLDYPGHYLRRIKTVSVSIPCVTGPNVNVNCKLTMTKNVIRDKENEPRENYEIQSIATSSAQNDAGVFELNLNGERYLSFEGAGVESSWKLELPEIASFDYQSISDAVLHIRYMAKDGGATMAEAATERVKKQLERMADTEQMPPVVLLSMKTAFPTAWHRFLNPENGSSVHELDVELLNKHYPYFSSLFDNRAIEEAEIGILLKEAPSGGNMVYDVNSGTAITINEGELYGVASSTTPSNDLGNVVLNFNTTPSVDNIDDIFLILKYKVYND